MQINSKLGDLLKKYSHAWVLAYMFIYLPWFTFLERTVRKDSDYNIMYSKLDSLIPFNEYFVIPYILWFAYVAIAIIYFLFADKEDFYKLTAFLFTGMTICLIIYTIFPNGQALRVTTFPRDNIFTDLVKGFYSGDTPTNVCPSIHCFNSIGVTIAVFMSSKLKKKQIIKFLSLLMTVSIMLSTLFIKQHSIVDMFGAMILSVIIFIMVYIPDYSKLTSTIKPALKKKLAITSK